MKRVAVVALALVLGLTLPAFAQRGGGGGHGGGGGFGGHVGGGGFHGGGFSGGFHGGGFASPHFSAPRYSGGFAARPYGYPGGMRYARPYSPYARPYSPYAQPGYRSGFRAPYNGREFSDGRDREDRFGRRSFFGRGAFFYPFWDWIGLGPLGCYDDAYVYGGDDEGYYGGPDCYGDDFVGPDQPMIYGDDGGDNGVEQPGYPPPPPPDYVPPAYEPPPPPDSSPKLPANQIATTIVFKDGRSSEQIHNYALTGTTLYVLDQQHSDIPVDQIDLAATEKANRAAGIEFQVPQSTQ
jgi:hypothetical protein